MKSNFVFLIFLSFSIFGWNSAEINQFDNSNGEDKPIIIHTVQRIQKDGYPVEEHFVETSDGYILALHRIPYSPKNGNKKSNKRPVYIQHGLFTSSSDWILSGPNKGLAYLLSDIGYDIWMGNFRGNTYSRNHSSINPDKQKFWRFSWNEIGLYDLPAMIDYILNKTDQESLHYVGHSQGTTTFFVLASSNTDYNKKIKSFHALAPVAYMGHSQSPFIIALAPFLGNPNALVEIIGSMEFLPNNEIINIGGYYLCTDTSPIQELCAHLVFLLCGYDTENLNRTLLPEIFATTPAGASVNQILHYVQLYRSETFRKFDYGFARNLIEYGSFSPPEYDLKKVTAPTALYWGDNDWLAAVEDVQILTAKLGNVQINYRIPYKLWNHLNYLHGINAKEYLYDTLMENINKFEED